MTTNKVWANSQLYYINNGDTTEGFFDARACVTKAGFGYNGRVAQQCDTGYYNAADKYSPCTFCGFGQTTKGVGKGVTSADCGIAAGYGFDAVRSVIAPCPVGTYNSANFTTSLTAACTPCPTGLTTAAEGSDSADQCAYCMGGYGGANCASACGGLGASATYGPPGRGVAQDPSCVACTTQTTGYSFEWQMQNELFVSLPLSKPYANSSLDCIAQYGQLVDGAW